MLFKIINDLVVDILVGLILTVIKAIARIEDISSSPPERNPSRNIFLEHKYSHWEQAILWLEDITESKFSYMESQIRFITTLIGTFYGCMVGLILTIVDKLVYPELSPFGILGISIVAGVVFGYLGGKSLVDRPDIFDVSSDEFKGENFDR
jgi:ABC-type Fe3+-siderophore transport system permease subunit